MNTFQQLINLITELGLDYTASVPNSKSTVLVNLSGNKRLNITTSFMVVNKRIKIQVFVCRRPMENELGVFHFLLKRNYKLAGLAYTVDNLGDIYLVGNFPDYIVSLAWLDEILGQIMSTADNDFNTLLELGFASSIKKEWNWRIKNGIPTTNLAAFKHLFIET